METFDLVRFDVVTMANCWETDIAWFSATSQDRFSPQSMQIFSVYANQHCVKLENLLTLL